MSLDTITVPFYGDIDSDPLQAGGVIGHDLESFSSITEIKALSFHSC